MPHRHAESRESKLLEMQATRICLRNLKTGLNNFARTTAQPTNAIKRIGSQRNRHAVCTVTCWLKQFLGITTKLSKNKPWLARDEPVPTRDRSFYRQIKRCQAAKNIFSCNRKSLPFLN